MKRLFDLEYLEMTAMISPDHLYRYRLSRLWSRPRSTRIALFIMLNPSTADQEKDDPTIRRCVGFAKLWGFDGIYICNLFGYRATDPKRLRAATDPMGPDNLRVILETSQEPEVERIVAGWGANDRHFGAGILLKRALQEEGHELFHLGMTKEGHPKHPLYLPASVRPIPWP